MSEQIFPYLDGAPITEAVIAVGFERADSFDQSATESFAKEIAAKFNAEVEQLVTLETSFGFSEGKPDLQQRQVNRGCKLTFDDGRYVVQCLPDMLALSRLQKYEGGEKFIQKFEEIWDAYCTYLRPQKIKRIGMRYINQFQCTRTQYAQFFNITPGMNLGDMGIRTISSVHTIYSKKLDCSAIIRTQEVGEADWIDSTNLNIILDVDAFRSLDSSVFHFGEVKACLNQVRTMKNEIFFMNLTEDGAKHFGAC